jgi:hypothetical protein
MDKPEPLFPTIAACPVCSKRTRLKWESAKQQLPPGLERLALLNCHACGKAFVRAVGTPEGIASFASSLQARHQHHHDHVHGEHGEHCDHEHYEARIVGRQDRYAYIELPPHSEGH